MARTWGVTPAQLREVTVEEFNVMVELLIEEGGLR